VCRNGNGDELAGDSGKPFKVGAQLGVVGLKGREVKGRTRGTISSHPMSKTAA